MPDDLGFHGTRLEKPHCPTAALRRFDRMRPQDAERIGVATDEKRIDSRALCIYRSLRGRRIFLRHRSILSKMGGGNQWGEYFDQS